MANVWQDLNGARVRRVDLPRPDLLAVSLKIGDDKPVLIAALSDTAGVGLVDERPRGDPAEGFARQLRKHLGNARLAAAEAGPGWVRIDFTRGAGRCGLALELGGPSWNVLLLDVDGNVQGAARAGALSERGLAMKGPWSPPGRGSRVPDDVDGLRRAGAVLLADRAEARVSRAKRALVRAIDKSLKRVRRRRDKVAADASRAAGAPDLRDEASLILAHLSSHRPGDDHLVVTDWTVDPPVERRITIDPSLGPKAHADRLYHRARRLERGEALAAERLAHADEETAALCNLRSRCEHASETELAELVEEARSTGVRGAREALAGSAPGRAKRSRGRLPFRRFVGVGDHPILVGRGARDNDELTLHHARPTDLWLHARGRRGAHVIVPLDRGATCPPEVLLDAATLAAHFSDAAGEQMVEIQHTPRRYLRKPRGAGPGLVLVDRETVLVLRVEQERLERLKLSEVED